MENFPPILAPFVIKALIPPPCNVVCSPSPGVAPTITHPTEAPGCSVFTGTLYEAGLTPDWDALPSSSLWNYKRKGSQACATAHHKRSGRPHLASWSSKSPGPTSRPGCATPLASRSRAVLSSSAFRPTSPSSGCARGCTHSSAAQSHN